MKHTSNIFRNLTVSISTALSVTTFHGLQATVMCSIMNQITNASQEEIMTVCELDAGSYKLSMYMPKYF